MKVFISWSDERSFQLAKALQWWLKRVNQRVEPWLSSDDIGKGTRWAEVLAARLETMDMGILCLTRENMTKPWILFEAGALSKKGVARVIPFLVGVEVRELPSPLQQFNAAVASNKEDVRGVVHELNLALAADMLSPEELDAAFEKWWPDLATEISKIPESPVKAPDPPDTNQLLALLGRQMEELRKELSRREQEEPAKRVRPQASAFLSSQLTSSQITTELAATLDAARASELAMVLHMRYGLGATIIRALMAGNLPNSTIDAIMAQLAML